MARVRIARSAEADLLEGYVFYERQQAGVGDYFLDSLYSDIDALALHAGIHPKPDGRLHSTEPGLDHRASRLTARIGLGQSLE